MKTKLEAIEWALAHIDEVIYFEGRRYQIVGLGLVSDAWVALCRVKIGWIELDFNDCILSDLTEEDDNQFSYLSIDEIKDLWDRIKD